VAMISTKSIGKLNSEKATSESVKNGFSENQHFETAKNIKTLYENATLKESTPDKHGNKEVKIHRYIANFMLDGQPAQAKITLKETLNGIYKGNKIYTIELESIAKLPTEP
ncbi:LPD3 domain-containing protein, partial [Helicobacter sp. T3_23-1059]